jgi:hypothetical protein
LLSDQRETAAGGAANADGVAGKLDHDIAIADEIEHATEEATLRRRVDVHDGPILRAIDLPRLVMAACFENLFATHAQIPPTARLRTDELAELVRMLRGNPRQQGEILVGVGELGAKLGA